MSNLEMKFGKYRGLPIESVARKDPNYFLWAIANVAGFVEAVPESCKAIATERSRLRRYASTTWSDEDQDACNEGMADQIEDDQDALDELFGMSDGKYGGGG